MSQAAVDDVVQFHLPPGAKWKTGWVPATVVKVHDPFFIDLTVSIPQPDDRPALERIHKHVPRVHYLEQNGLRWDEKSKTYKRTRVDNKDVRGSSVLVEVSTWR